MGIRSRLRLPTGAPIAPERQLSGEAGLTITIHSLFQFGASMAGLFLNLYLWRLTESLYINGIYNLIVYLMTPVGFAIGGWIAKRKDRLVTYRLGIMMTAVFFLLVVFAQEAVVRHYLLFALLNGLSAGLYWIGYLVLMYDVTTDSNRERYLGLNMAYFSAAGLVGPALAGWIIGQSPGLQGYVITFMLSFVMFMIAAVLSLRMRTAKTRHRRYFLGLMPLLMTKSREWVKALLGFFIFGLFQGAMLFLPSILLYRTVGREDWVGYLGVFFSSVVIATGYVMSRKANERGTSLYILIAASAVVATSSILLVDINLWTVILFMTAFSVSNPLTINTLNAHYYRLIGKLPLKGQIRNEVVVIRETFLNGGRILSIVLLVFVAKDLQSSLLPLVLLGTGLMQFGVYGLLAVRRKSRANG
jgi:MFS transporter, YQGE family, putative transporter